jgi:hypothetical protein
MDAKKTLSGIVLALAIATTPGLSQQNQQEKLNFSLGKSKRPAYCLDIKSRPELKSYIKLQETLRSMGEEYSFVIVPGDRMRVYYHNRNMDPGMEMKPDLKFYDDKFVIEPDPTWRGFPEGLLDKFYKKLPKKPTKGFLVCDFELKKNI